MSGHTPWEERMRRIVAEVEANRDRVGPDIVYRDPFLDDEELTPQCDLEDPESCESCQ